MFHSNYSRRSFLRLAALGGATALATPSLTAFAAPVRKRENPRRVKPFALEEVTIPELQHRMQTGKETAVSLVRKYLARIEEIDRRGPALNSVIELNPDAPGIAAALDKERRTKGPRGPLHGIPVLIKDNLDTHDRMMTTAGSLALVGSIPPRDCFVVEKLRAAGVVLLGKTNLSEWANFRGSFSTSGWSGRGGQTRNPYVLDRNPSGSSSGSAAAVAANLCGVAVGTETDGSIISPSSYCGIVGLKPTVGLISRSGIIPIAHSQDTAGPMARTVTDAALLLGAMGGPDPRDPATADCAPHTHADYTRFLDPNSLRGARIGVARSLFGNFTRLHPLMEEALGLMKRLGADLLDPVEVPKGNKLDDAELEVLRYELKADMNAYLAALGPQAPRHTLQDLIAFNQRNSGKELRWFGQEEFEKAQAKGPLTDPAYLEAVATCRRVGREALTATIDKLKLDAIVAPSSGPAHVTDWVAGDRGVGDIGSPAGVAGCPSITVPLGQIWELPVGISFFSKAWSEPKLLGLAFAFEQATHARRPPRFLRSLENE